MLFNFFLIFSVFELTSVAMYTCIRVEDLACE